MEEDDDEYGDDDDDYGDDDEDDMMDTQGWIK